MKRKARLPPLSPHLARYARTNSEPLLGVRSFPPDPDSTRGVAITSSVHPEPVPHIEPLSPDGAEGYLVPTRKTTGLLRGPRGLTFKAKGLVLGDGTLGTNTLLLDLKASGRLPGLSGHVGRYVRTNSETLLGVRSLAPGTDFTRGGAITSSVHPDATGCN